ncbi:MAG: phosphatase PAP2 family protein [Chloroflexota bacterium]|nr:phosphatase PAP2 family protein [Chloroflexota bacterium]
MAYAHGVRASASRVSWLGARGAAPLGAALRGDRRARSVLVLLAVLAAAVTAFAHVAEDYLTHDPLARWDVDFARWLHEHSTPALVEAFDVVTLAGNAVVLLLVALAAAVVVARRARISEAALLLGAYFGAEALNATLKVVFHRPRPELAFVDLETYSFPSGHAMASTVVYVLVAHLVAGAARHRVARLGAFATAAALVGAICFSRLYLGAHYLSDVLAGVSAGLAWLAACLLVYEAYSGRRELGQLVRRRRSG